MAGERQVKGSVKHPTPSEARAVQRKRHEGIAESAASVCDWSSGVCLTRAKLRRKVQEASRLPATHPGKHGAFMAANKALATHHCEPAPLPTHEEVMAAVRAYGAACDGRASATAAEYSRARVIAERTYADLSHKVARLVDAESNAAPSLTTVCAWCKWCVRDGKRVPTSHGICETCSEEHFGETPGAVPGGER